MSLLNDLAKLNNVSNVVAYNEREIAINSKSINLKETINICESSFLIYPIDLLLFSGRN